jgi:hypothetical protein
MDPDGRDSVPSLMVNGQAEGMCRQDASGACTVEAGPAAYDGEKAWLASNTASDKSKRGAEHGAAAAAAFNAKQAARPRLTVVAPPEYQADAHEAQLARIQHQYPSPYSAVEELAIAAAITVSLYGGVFLIDGLLSAGAGEAAGVAVSSAPVFNFVAKNGQKINQQIGRWLEAGYATLSKSAPFQEKLTAFLSHANDLATRATAAGTFAVGRVGEMASATIFRVGSETLVIEGSTIMSYVSETEPGEGIDLVYQALGGK